MAAASPKTQSLSYDQGASLSRKCGSIYASAVCRLLCTGPPERCLAGEKVTQELIDNLDEPQYAMYSELARRVHMALFANGPFAYRVGVRLSSQGEEWEARASQGVGVPLHGLKETGDDQRMQKTRDATIYTQAGEVAQDRAVARSTKRFFGSIGKTLRKLSPVKRWSSGSGEKSVDDAFERLSMGSGS